MNILFLYNQTQTYTNTVFEHINSFSRYSQNTFLFAHHDQNTALTVDLSKFEVICIHYSIRLPFDQIADYAADNLAAYAGLKVLFIQDEYDHTHRAWYWIKRLGVQLVFTVVPMENIALIYPPDEFPGVRFVNNLTGYVPEDLHYADNVCPASDRALVVGYRGRPLPIRYGQLGQEKIGIGRLVKRYCDSKGVRNDIAWTEDSRIYGPKWYEFMISCRAMLGSESGSNVFDWDGKLTLRIQDFVKSNPKASEYDIYSAVVAQCEVNELMNQVSPRIFEAIASGTALVLFEGKYSSVVTPIEHYIPLKKDGSNLSEVIELLQNGKYVDEMTQRAYQDIIASGKYSYQNFVQFVDQQIQQTIEAIGSSVVPKNCGVDFACINALPCIFTALPKRSSAPFNYKQACLHDKIKYIFYRIWGLLHDKVRRQLKLVLKKLFVIG